jgi:N-acetylglucosaminyl-diphospho-decaprenol L-rhamnosyltransferase
MDVLIINHNTRDQLRACLATIAPCEARRVVVVDNASTDDSAAMVREAFPWVDVCANQANPGYGAAANQGLAACEAPYVLLLNSDTRLQPETLKALEQYLDANPRAAIVGPRLLNPDGTLQPSCYPFPTPLHVFLQESGLGHWLAALPFLRGRYLRAWPHARSRVVPWVLGAALGLRREALRAVRGFDPSFFMYAEEVDLAYRLSKAGWQTHFTPSTSIIHIGGASTRQQRTRMMVQYFISLQHFYRQHFAPWRLSTLLVIMKAIALARFVRDTIRLRFTTEASTRDELRESIGAWQRFLLHRPVEQPRGERVTAP